MLLFVFADQFLKGFSTKRATKFGKYDFPLNGFYIKNIFFKFLGRARNDQLGSNRVT